MQRRKVAAQFQPSSVTHHKTVLDLSESCLLSEGITREDGAIVVPASSCSAPTKPTSKVLWLSSALGGQQLYLEKDAEVVYDVSSNLLNGSTEFELTLRVSTAHRFEEPILMTITDNSLDIDTVYVVKLPYTLGLWEYTEPIQISVAENTKIKLHRPDQPFGFSFKEIRLVPL